MRYLMIDSRILQAILIRLTGPFLEIAVTWAFSICSVVVLVIMMCVIFLLALHLFPSPSSLISLGWILTLSSFFLISCFVTIPPSFQ